MTRWFDQDKSNETDIIKSVDGQGCPRCGGTVYEVEVSNARMCVFMVRFPFFLNQSVRIFTFTGTENHETNAMSW